MDNLQKEASPEAASVTPVEEFLNKVEIFKNLPKESVQLIDRRIRKMYFKKGEQIMSEFDNGKGIFFVHSGIVKLTSRMSRAMR